MIEINLLPREYRKRSNPLHFDKKWIYVGSAVVVMFALLFGLTFLKTHNIAKLEKKIASIQKQRTALDKDIRLIDNLTDLKQKLLTRMTAIEKLDKTRGMWVSILEDLNTRVPEMLWLTDIKEEQPVVVKAKNKRAPKKSKPKNDVKVDSTTVAPKKKTTTIEGYAYTLSSIASFLVSMVKSDYFEDIKLTYARQEALENIAAYDFKINCVINYDAWLEEKYQPENIMTSPLAKQ
jgi:Tfp pilus assembly protein PilN